MKIFKDNQIVKFGKKITFYKTDSGCIILISKDDGLDHLSISHSDRYPTWDEIKQARYDLLCKTKTFAMLLPPEDQYVNLHPNCFHLYQLQDGEIINGKDDF